MVPTHPDRSHEVIRPGDGFGKIGLQDHLKIWGNLRNCVLCDTADDTELFGVYVIEAQSGDVERMGPLGQTVSKKWCPYAATANNRKFFHGKPPYAVYLSDGLSIMSPKPDSYHAP